MKTLAAVLEGPGRPFELRELELAEPGHGEILIKYAASGLCHSDLHLIDGDIIPRFPIVAGHEGSGVVEAVGPGVTRLAVGDHVVCSFLPSCGTCRYCSIGAHNLCDSSAHVMNGNFPDGTFRLSDGARQVGSLCMLGTFSERAVIPQESAVRIDPWTPLEAAALVGCGVPTGWGTAVNAGGIRVGDAVVIYGVGGVGMNSVQGAVAAGAKFVAVVDPIEFKRDMALSFGATHVFADAEEAATKMNELTWGQGADQAIVTVGVVDEHVVSHAFDVIGKRGTLVIAGQSHPDAITIRLPSALLVRSEKVIRGAQYGSCNPHLDILRLLRLYDAGQLKLDELITRRYRLEDINDAIRDLREDKLIRGLIVHE